MIESPFRRLWGDHKVFAWLFSLVGCCWRRCFEGGNRFLKLFILGWIKESMTDDPSEPSSVLVKLGIPVFGFAFVGDVFYKSTMVNHHQTTILGEHLFYLFQISQTSPSLFKGIHIKWEVH